jgi:sugar/nucleoside kinase (ribokinase family)
MAIDYLVIGHITKDLVSESSGLVVSFEKRAPRSLPKSEIESDRRPEATTFKGIGGTALYAARTARALGCSVGIVTSASPEIELSPMISSMSNEAQIVCIPAAETTTFENCYINGNRRQIIHSVAGTLTSAMVPSEWEPTIVHLGPVAQECDSSLIETFTDAFIGLTLQGWLRRWDQTGQVYPHYGAEVEKILAQADAVVVSEEDVAGDQNLIERYASQAQILILTQGEKGCTVYTGGYKHHIPTLCVKETDPTGAGDIFAAAFFVNMEREGNPWKAAHFANCIASHSVTRRGALASTPREEEITRCEQIAEERPYAPHLRTG